MIISHKYKFIFFKTRKTAGSAVESMLYPYLDKQKDICTGSPLDGTPRLNNNHENGHICWRNYEEYIGKYYTFSIERNPWDKVVSSYYFHKNIKTEQYGAMDFEEYLNCCPSLPLDWHMYSANNKIVLDNVFKWECFYELFNYLRIHFNICINKKIIDTVRPKSKYREIRDYKKLHNERTKLKIKELFNKEINYFKYEY